MVRLGVYRFFGYKITQSDITPQYEFSERKLRCKPELQPFQVDKHPEDCFKTHADLKHNNFLKPDTYNLYGLGLSNPLSPFFLFILKSSTRRTLLSDRQQHHPRSMGPSSRRLPPLPRAHLRSGSAPPESSIFGRPPQRGYPPSSIQPARRASRRRHTHPSHTDTAPGAPLACFPREGRS